MEKNSNEERKESLKEELFVRNKSYWKNIVLITEKIELDKERLVAEK